MSTGHDSGFSGGAGAGANGTSRVLRVFKSGMGGDIRAKIVCVCSFLGMLDCSAAGSWLYFAKRRRWLNEVSRVNFESRTLKVN